MMRRSMVSLLHGSYRVKSRRSSKPRPQKNDNDDMKTRMHHDNNTHQKHLPTREKQLSTWDRYQSYQNNNHQPKRSDEDQEQGNTKKSETKEKEDAAESFSLMMKRLNRLKYSSDHSKTTPSKKSVKRTKMMNDAKASSKGTQPLPTKIPLQAASSQSSSSSSSSSKKVPSVTSSSVTASNASFWSGFSFTPKNNSSDGEK